MLGDMHTIDVYGDGIKYAAHAAYLDLGNTGVLREYLVVPNGPKKYIETSKLPPVEIERLVTEIRHAEKSRVTRSRELQPQG
jgi:hypothetical protein